VWLSLLLMNSLNKTEAAFFSMQAVLPVVFLIYTPEGTVGRILLWQTSLINLGYKMLVRNNLKHIKPNNYN